jgi:hypothetical protein
VLPMLRMEPVEPMERMDPADPMLRMDPADPMERIEPKENSEPNDSAEYSLRVDRQDVVRQDVDVPLRGATPRGVASCWMVTL